MTPEELDRVRADEAARVWDPTNCATRVAVIAARLAREGWTPPPAVPADLLRAREIVAGVCNGRECPEMAQAYISGGCDKSYTLEAARIALHDPTFVIPAEVDDEMRDVYWRERDDCIFSAILAVLNLLRDRAAKQMEALG